MRIVAGRFKGRRIQAPPTTDTRPTTDRVREALMSSLVSAAGAFGGLRALDAFAGSGALGLEVLSRGADRVTFFETDRRALSTLRSNIVSLDVASSTRVVQGDVRAAARRGTVAGGPFSLILLDPPYRLGTSEVYGLLSDLAGSGALADEAWVSYEFHDPDFAADLEPPDGFTTVARKRYGTTGTLVLEYVRREDAQ